MIFIIEIVFILVLASKRSWNKGYLFLVLLQVCTLCMGPFVANYVNYKSYITLLNVFFVFTNLFFVVTPWRFANFSGIVVDNRFQNKYESILSKVLAVLGVCNLLVYAIVVTYLPNISEFKNELAFTNLYNTIPFFSIAFRVTSTTQYFGYFALPISCYYFHKKNLRRGVKFFILSLSSLSGALASYSRAGILTYVFTCVCFFLITFSLYSSSIRQNIWRFIKCGFIFFVTIFMTITVVRFSAMSYYADRIPKESLIKDPIIYSIFDYASQGFPHGISQLDAHDSKDVLYGGQTFYNINQVLSFFHIIDWSSEGALDQFEKSYNKVELGDNNFRAFHGYTCRLVKDFGYCITLMISFIYFLYVKKKCRKVFISIDELSVLILLLTQPIISLYYASYGLLIVPILFYQVVKRISR